MGTAEFRVGVSGQDRFGDKARALTELDESMQSELRDAILVVAAQLAQRARERVLEEPTHGSKHTGLRREVAAGVDLTPKSDGARITTSMPDTDERSIPRGLDNGVRGWRHPVYGHDRWVSQRGAFSWFMEVMSHGKSDVEDSLERVLRRAAEKVADA